MRIMRNIKYALIAQLDRALGYELRGREFESLSAPLEELTAIYSGFCACFYYFNLKASAHGNQLLNDLKLKN